VRIAIATGVTAMLLGLVVFTATDREAPFERVAAAAVLFGVIVGGLVLLWTWAL
jgi:hypothetical protein